MRTASLTRTLSRHSQTHLTNFNVKIKLTTSYKRMASTTTDPKAAMLESFHNHLQSSKRIVALLGAGLSASSGLPTFRGAGGLWRTHDAVSLATPEAFARDPAFVWQ